MALHFTTGTTPTEQDSEWNLLAKILITLNNLATISPSGAPDGLTYAGPPTFTPTQANGEPYIVVDSNGRQWQYFNGGWN
jgi:hypothetical protein